MKDGNRIFLVINTTFQTVCVVLCHFYKKQTWTDIHIPRVAIRSGPGCALDNFNHSRVPYEWCLLELVNATSLHIA